MHISSIAEGAELTITAQMGKEKMEFKTNARYPIGDTLLVEEVKNSDGEPVSLLSDEVYLTVACLNENNVPIIWNDVMIKHISFMGEELHRIAETSEGKATNRRGAFRVYIGRAAMLQKGLNRAAIEVILKDISTSGFSFVTTEELDMSGVDSVHIVCEMSDYRINAYGTIVRQFHVPDSQKIIYGCKSAMFDKTLDKFIMNHQRELLKKQPQSVTLRRADEEEMVDDGKVRMIE